MALTDTAIRSARPKERAYKLFDGGGLFLFITTKGSKLWRYRFRFNGAEQLVSLGSYPAVSLKDARERRDAAKRQLAAGKNPSLERKRAKIEAAISAKNSFQAVAEDFIEVKLVAAGKASATIEKARWFLSHLTPALGARPIADIEPVELLSVLKKIEAAGKRETANRVRNFASRVFRFGASTARCKVDPAALLSDALAAPMVKNRAAILDPEKLGEFLRSIDEYDGGEVVKLAMQILPHVFLRPGELRYGRWSELDLKELKWTIPAERTKLRRPHSVPLSRQVQEMLQRLHKETGEIDLMFPGRTSHLKPISENTLNNTFRRMGYGSDIVTAHGLRATASTLLNESGKWHPDAIERALAHGHSDAVRGVYARGQHWEERVKMAQWWSDFLEGLKAKG